jgi:protein-disulfide isomerase
MKSIKLAAIGMAAIALSGAAAPGNSAGSRANWLATVNLTPAGGHVMGNPDAKAKLTEYVSYTCSHCSHFEIESGTALKIGYVQPGKVSVEIAHLVRDPVDLTAALLTNCGTPAQFFANHTLFMRSQQTWMKVMDTASDAQRSRWSNGPMAGRLQAIASDFRFYDMMSRRGYSRIAVNACLADQGKINRIMAMRQAAMDAGVQGTPSFAINGTLLADAHSWGQLQTALNDALN